MSVISMSSNTGATITSGTVASTTGGAGGHTRIVLDEVKAMINNPHEHMDVYVSEKNMGFWKVVMQSPPGSPYANGTFALYIEVGKDYPTKPPTARFLTSVLHLNVTKHGSICRPLFDRG